MQALNTCPENKEDFVCIFRRWNIEEDRKMVNLFYDKVPVSEIGEALDRDGLQIFLRLIEIGIVAPTAIGMLWDDYFLSSEIRQTVKTVVNKGSRVYVETNRTLIKG